MTEQFVRKMEEGVKLLGIQLSEKQLEQFYDYFQFLVEKNKVMNLTAITEEDAVITKHFCDSLCLVKGFSDIEKTVSLIDVGTGAGFPGIPLKLEGKDINRISFNEITQSAVKASLKQPRDIDMNLVNAQQARRILDRIVGYKISPLLWAKVKRGLSAGRVQSVALRIICDREEEINAFIPEEYWTLDAELKIAGEKKPLLAKFYGDSESKMNISSREEMDRVMAEISKEKFKVIEVKKGERVKKAPLPFTTSTLQQEASKALNFPISKTMRIAQQLYEGVDVKGQGTVGLITYLRTDSVRISEEADAQAHEYIGKNYGENYLATQTTAKKSGAKIQDAHEAILFPDFLLPKACSTW